MYKQLVVPASLRLTVLHGCHGTRAAGHKCAAITYEKLTRSFYWPGASSAVELHCKTCPICARSKRGIWADPSSPSQPYTGGEPNELLHVDLLGPFSTSDEGNNVVLVMVDSFSKFVQAFPMVDSPAEAVARVIFHRWCLPFGTPQRIMSDQGRNFESELIAALCEFLEADKARTTPYRPSANGQVERMNTSITEFIRCFAMDKPFTWCQYVELAANAINTSVNRDTGFTPVELFQGRQHKLPIQTLLGTNVGRKDGQTYPDYVLDLQNKVKIVHHAAREKIQTCRKYRKIAHDGELFEKLRRTRYTVGDAVFKRKDHTTQGISKKLEPKWVGPLIITHISDTGETIWIEDEGGNLQTTHHDKLKRCHAVPPIWLKRKELILKGNLSTVETTGGTPNRHNIAPQATKGGDESHTAEEPAAETVRRSTRTRNPPQRYDDRIAADRME